jgi:hypothetical protein
MLSLHHHCVSYRGTEDNSPAYGDWPIAFRLELVRRSRDADE